VSDSFATPWTVAHQVPLFMGFSRQEYWSGCHLLLHTHTHTHTMLIDAYHLARQLWNIEWVILGRKEKKI